MPMPSIVQFGTGQLAIDRSFSIAVIAFQDAALERGVQRFAAELSRQTGMLLKSKPFASASPSLLIHAEHGCESSTETG
jgi:hypothetical protein